MTYFIPGSLYLLTSFTRFAPSPPTACSLYWWAIFVLVGFHMVGSYSICLSVWFISLSTYEEPWVLHMLLKMAEFHSFYGWLIFQCMYSTFSLSFHSCGHLGFHVLAIISNATVNKGVGIFEFVFLYAPDKWPDAMIFVFWKYVLG